MVYTLRHPIPRNAFMPLALAHPLLDENNAVFEQARSLEAQLTRAQDDPYKVAGRFFV